MKTRLVRIGNSKSSGSGGIKDEHRRGVCSTFERCSGE